MPTKLRTVHKLHQRLYCLNIMAAIEPLRVVLQSKYGNFACSANLATKPEMGLITEQNALFKSFSRAFHKNDGDAEGRPA